MLLLVLRVRDSILVWYGVERVITTVDVAINHIVSAILCECLWRLLLLLLLWGIRVKIQLVGTTLREESGV